MDSKPEFTPVGDAGRRVDPRAGRFSAATLLGFVIGTVYLLPACGFTVQAVQTPQDVYDILDDSRYVEPYAGNRWTVVDDPKLRVEHGWSCAQAPSAASQEYIGLRILEFTQLPTNFNGTVFLNGWHLEYKSKDHHVVGLGATIFNIAQLNDKLVWNAGGVLSDNDGNDGYRWCYEYTTVAWPKPSTGPIGVPNLQPYVDVQALHSNPQARFMYVDGSTVDGVDKIAGSYRSTGRKPRAVLLAGFGASHADDDHHVLQIGFDLGKPKVKGKRIKWTSSVAFKDKSTRNPRTAEIVSVLSGESVNVFHPPSASVVGGDAPLGGVTNDFTLRARTDVYDACLGGAAERTVQMAVVTPPYTWAVPMLTGWDLQNPCNDSHLTHAGVWIEDFHYVRASGASNGTLYYTIKSNFGDKDNFPGMTDRVQVDVLGINLLQPVVIGP